MATEKQQTTDVEKHSSSENSTSPAAVEYDALGNRIYVQSAAEISLLRKLDFIYVMPFVAVLNFLQFFDKSTLNYAGVLGIKEDTGTTADQFRWLGSLFYLGYLVYQLPNQFLLQRLTLSKYTGSLIVLWGTVLAVTFEAKTFGHLSGLRFLLGFFEAAIYPCCIILISTLYRRKEQSIRIGIVYIFNGIAMAFGGLIGYGIGHMDGARGHRAWQWMMLILGVVTIAFGIFTFFFLVDNPKSRFLRLTPEQEAIVDERQRDNGVVRTKEFKFYQIVEALKEPRYYCISFASLLIQFQNGALTTFSSIITAGFGYSNLDAILLTVPSGVIDIIYIVITVWYNRKYGNTLYTASVLLSFTILGLVLLLAIPTAKVKLVGLYLCWSFPAAYTLMLVTIANNVAGYTKKIFYSTSLIVFYTIGNFCGPLMIVSHQAPLYLGAMLAYIAADVICIVLLLVARYTMAKSNKERLPNIQKSDAADEATDLTDRENPNYIYRL